VLVKIAAFELRYQVRSALFFIGFAIFFLLTFGSVTVDQIQIGGRGNVHLNAPLAILQTIGVMNVFGRFLGAWLAALLVMASVPLAILIGSAMPWQDPEKLGPLVVGDYLYAFFVYSVPTLLAASAGFFAVATATRSMMWTYVAVLASLVLFFTSQSLLSDPAFDTISALADPFGFVTLDQATKYWTASERNTQLPELSGLLLYNRLLWTAVAAVLFVLAYVVFRFEKKAGKPDRKTRAAGKSRKQPASDSVAPAIGKAPRSTTATVPASWQQLAALTRFEFKFVFKSPAFFVLLALGVFNALNLLVQTIEVRGTEFLPVTRAMVQALDGAFTLFPIIIAIYYAGELVWRDRERHIHEIIDASAAPNWTFMVPKVIAISLVLLACFLVASATGMLFQLAKSLHICCGSYCPMWFSRCCWRCWRCSSRRWYHTSSWAGR